MTVFEHIEKLKRDYTDKFVLVDDRCAELARFKGQTGRVKTVNMNGRALVEFDHHSNVGWFDIDVDYLKVIERPKPKEEKKVKASGPAAKTAPSKAAPAAKEGAKQLSPLEKARMQDGTKAASGQAGAAASGSMSIAEKLAAARGDAPSETAPAEAKGASAGSTEKASGSMSIAEKLAAAGGDAPSETAPAEAKGASAGSAEKASGSMSIAEKLAAARGDTGSTVAPAKDPSEMTIAEKLAAARGAVESGTSNTNAEGEGATDAVAKEEE